MCSIEVDTPRYFEHEVLVIGVEKVSEWASFSMDESYIVRLLRSDLATFTATGGWNVDADAGTQEK